MFKTKIIFIFLLCLVFLEIHSQNKVNTAIKIYSQINSHVDSIIELLGDENYEKAKNLCYDLLDNHKTLDEDQLAQVYCLLANAYVEECSFTLNFKNVDSIKYLAEISLKILKKIPKKNDLQIRNYYALGAYYFIKQNYIESKSYYKKTIESCEEKKQFDILYITSFKQIGELNSLLRKPDSAYFYFQKAIKINEKYFNNSERQEADIYYQISLIQHLDFNKQIDAAFKAKKLYSDLYGDFSFQMSELNSSLSGIFSSKGEYKTALNYCLKNIQIFDSIHFNNRTKILMNYLDVIRSYDNIKNFDSVLYFANIGLQKFESINDPYILGELYNRKGRAEAGKYDYKNAINDYDKSITNFNLSKDFLLIEGVYMNIGTAYQNNGDFDNAPKYFKAALETAENNFGKTSHEAADAHISLGNFYSTTSQPKNALEEELATKDIFDKLYPNISAEKASILNDIGLAELGLKDFDSARNYYFQSLKMFENLGLEKTEDYALLLGCLSGLEQNFQNYNQSIIYTEKELKIYKDLFGEYSEKAALGYSTLGSLFQSTFRFSQAKENFYKALNIRLKKYGDNNESVAQSYFDLANLYRDLSITDSSIFFYNKVLKIYETVYPNGCDNVLNTYNTIADFYWSIEDFNNAKKINNKAFEVSVRLYGASSENTASIYISMSIHEQDSDSVIALLNKAENILLKINPNHPYLSDCYFQLADEYFKKGEYKKCENYEAKGLRIDIENYGEKSWNVALDYSRDALHYRDANMYSEAVLYLNTAIEIMKEIKGYNSSEVSNLKSDLFSTYLQFAHYDKAFGCLKEEENVLRKIYDTTNIAFAELYLSYGDFYFQLSEYQKALKFKRIGYKIAKTFYNGRSPKLVDYSNQLANCYASLEKPDSAIEIYYEGLRILKDIGYKDALDAAIIYNNIGTLYLGFNPSDAKDNFIKAVNIYQKKKRVFSKGTEISYGNLSIAYSDLSENKLALAYADSALMIAKFVYPNNSLNLATIYRIVAYGFEKQFLYDYSSNYYKQALNIYIEKFDSLNVEVILTLECLGHIKLMESKYDSANFYFSKALSLNQKMDNGTSGIISYLMFNKAESELFLEKYSDAWNSSKDAIDGKYKNWITLLPLMGDKDRENDIAELTSTFNLEGNIALAGEKTGINFSDEIFNNSIMLKEILFFQQKKLKNSSIENQDSSSINLYSKLQELSNKVSKIYELTPEQRGVNNYNIDSIERMLREIERKIALLNTDRNEKMNWVSIQQKINNDEAIVEFVKFNKISKSKVLINPDVFIPAVVDTSFYAALILTTETKEHPQLLLLKNGNELDNAYYTHYRQYLTNPKQREDKDWESYQHYWAAIDSAIGDKKIVYVSPDGVYNKINLQTLVTPDGKYLSDKKDIRIIGSSRDLLQPPSKNNKYFKDAILVGNPNFKTNTTIIDSTLLAKNQHKNDALLYTTRSFESTDISQLPAAEKEANTISALLKEHNYQTTTLIGNDAQEARIKAVSSPSILHIATHGFFEKDLKTNNDEKNIGSTFQKAIENPMLRSGLLLAGAENTIKGNYKATDGSENGILTAYEVQQMNLDSTELVVLSACETGLGDVKNGEGVYGLQRAFRIAGAKTIIMSLWKVDDEATQLLMTSFYEYWLSGKTKREAFKEAQEILKKSPRYSHPYYWGAFVLIGE